VFAHSAAARTTTTAILPFLTAFDPTDLPGGSLDPLGFDRAYGFLADRILPGLTNVASRPRYLGVLCAGMYLAPVLPGTSVRDQYRVRLDTVQRLERLWVLANLLASDREGFDSSGLRGSNYGREHLENLGRKGQQRTTADFRLLIRQVPYGAIGIYGNVGAGMRLFDRKDLAPTPDLGERLAKAFLAETEIPEDVRSVVEAKKEDVSLSTLDRWGTRAHLAIAPGPEEASCLHEALHREPTRSRMVHLLGDRPLQADEAELERLEAIAKQLGNTEGDESLAEALQTIVAFEEAYRLVMLGLQRLLWRVRGAEGGVVPLSELRNDDVLCGICRDLPPAVEKLERCLAAARSTAFMEGQERLADARQFLQVAANAFGETEELVEAIRARHADVQAGKLDRGRAKLPWLELGTARSA
jgi:hypothetical protein